MKYACPHAQSHAPRARLGRQSRRATIHARRANRPRRHRLRRTHLAERARDRRAEAGRAVRPGRARVLRGGGRRRPAKMALLARARRDTEAADAKRGRRARRGRARPGRTIGARAARVRIVDSRAGRAIVAGKTRAADGRQTVARAKRAGLAHHGRRHFRHRAVGRDGARRLFSGARAACRARGTGVRGGEGRRDARHGAAQMNRRKDYKVKKRCKIQGVDMTPLWSDNRKRNERMKQNREREDGTHFTG
jgi:hypothetical protein